MDAAEPQFIVVGHGADCRRIACLQELRVAAKGPGLVWLPGFKSEMTSTKASALAAWASSKGVSMTRFDYSGHGQSPGRVEDGTIGRWLEEARDVVLSHTTGDVILVGSSMGGYLALLLVKSLMREMPNEAQRVRALVLIAPAWDMTERLMKPRLSDSARRELEENGIWLRPSRYGDGPYPITRQLIEEGARHQIGNEAFNPGRPVHVLHGLQDPDVPWEHTLDLVAHLDGDWTRVTAVPDGDHRLSRPEDIDLLLNTVDAASAEAAK
jgi:pimeloyl-ACP methyl ester carboxylesterase